MPKPTDYDKTHLRNMAAIGTRIDRIFKKAAEEAAKIGVSIKSPLPEDRIFSFDDYPATKKQIERLMTALQESMETAIVNGVRSSWTLSNNKNNALVSRIFGGRVGDLSKEQHRRYFSTNGAALDAFLQRKAQGLNLSDKVWRYAESFKREIELGLDLGIRTGESAAQMSRSLRQYLQHPDKLFRRVRDQHGNLKLSKAARDYHPGRGVYRSSYKNARRLACTETNMAYRTSDHLRWQQMEFVVGIEIKLSNNHTLNGVPLTDICDTLAGRYPKDFKFVGWHPHCRCHVVTVLKTDDEMAEDTQRILAGEQPKKGSVNTVRDVPDAFKGWVEEHANRIEMSGNLPYFLKDNRKIISSLLTEKMPQLIAGTGDPIFDYIENYNLPKSIRDRFELYNSLKSFNDFKMFFAERGIELSTDFEELLDKADEYFEPIALQCRKLSIAYDTYTNLLGKDCLKSLKRINLFDNGEDMGSAQAAYFYNMIGEKDPWAGVLRIRTNNLNGHTAFHELAHVIQDSVKLRGEDAVIAASRIIKECGLDKSVGAYFGASAYAMEAERMADAFANVFTRKKMSKEFEFFTEVRKYLRHPQNEIKTIEEIAIKRHANRDVAKIQKTWNARRIANIEDAAKKGLFPKECLKGLSAMKLPEFNARIAYLQKTAQRHAARSPQDIEDIKKAWKAKLTRDKNTRIMADNVLKLRSEYPLDVDFSALEKIIADNNLTKLREEARNVAQVIKTIRAEEKMLSDIIPEVHEWHKSFNLESLKAVKTSILSKLDEFKAKGWGDFDTKTNLGHLKHSLEWQANYMATKGQLKYSTWEVAQKSYLKLVDKAQDLLDWENIETDIELLKVFKTKSKEFGNLLNNAIAAQAAGDKAKAQLWVYNAGLKKDQLEAAKAKAAAARAAKKAAASTEAPVSFGDECFTESRRKAAKIFRDAMEAESSELFDEASRLYQAATDAFKEAAEDYTEASGYLTKWLRGLDGYLESSLSYAQKAEFHTRELSRIIGQATLKRDMWLYRDERAAFLALKAGGLDPDTLQAQIKEYARKITARYKAAGRMTAKRTKELEEKIAWFTDWRARQLVGKKGIDPSILSCGSHEQHRFNGTGGDNRFGRPKVRLEIYCPKGTQALYAAPFNHYNRKVTSGRFWDGTSHTISIHEAEVFLQRDTEFRIVSARWDAKEDRWFVKVEVIGHRARDFEMQSTPRGYKAKFK